MLSCRTWVSSHLCNRNSNVSRVPSLRPSRAAAPTRSLASAESSDVVARARGAHPASRLGDGEPGLVPAAECLEPGPQEFARAGVRQFPVVAEPLLDIGQRELRADIRATDTGRERVVAATPVADRRTSHTGDPGDLGQADRYGVRCTHRRSPGSFGGRGRSASQRRSTCQATTLIDFVHRCESSCRCVNRVEGGRNADFRAGNGAA